MERAADCKKVREDVARLIYLCLGRHEFFRDFTKQRSAYLMRDPLSYVFSRLLMWMQYEKSVCGKYVFPTKFLIYRGKIKVKKTFFRLILSQKN